MNPGIRATGLAAALAGLGLAAPASGDIYPSHDVRPAVPEPDPSEYPFGQTAAAFLASGAFLGAAYAAWRLKGRKP